MSRRFTGTVVSDKPDQTVVVAIERSVNHPIYRKARTVTKKLYAHDPENKSKAGDVVTVEEIPPKSALKRWQVVEADVDTSAVKAVTEKTLPAKAKKEVENEAKEEATPTAEKPAADEKTEDVEKRTEGSTS
ncbi:30S ribosomal protein S17 [Patescibacteria group bacterium]|nr:30S ribosomal protein S17 [Patescibacteria group bacterium]